MGLRERFGRPLRLAIIGGGPDAWIGRMHRGAAEMDGWFRATAGVFSSDPARSRAAGAALGFDPERSYGDVAEMLERERAAGRRRRRGGDHDAERHALPVRRCRARRGTRRRLRQAGHARFRAGLRPRRPHARARPDLRDRARVFRVSDDPLRTDAGARRHARADPARAGRIHPERARDAARGRPAEQPPGLVARSAAAAGRRW